MSLDTALPLVSTSLLWVIVGKKGMGKSTLTAEVIEEYIRQKKRRNFVVFDTRLGMAKDLLPLGFQIAKISNPRPIRWDSVLESNPRLLIYTEGLTMEETHPHIDAMAQALLRRGDTLLWFDEAHQFYPSPEERAPRGLRLLVRDSRKRAVDLGFTTQIVVDLAISALKQADILCTFKLTEENDLKKMGQYFDREQVTKLDRFEYLVLDQTHGIKGRGRTRRRK